MDVVVPLNKAPTRDYAREIIRTLVSSGQIRLSKHAKERMLEREITIQQVMTCLTKGKVTTDPTFIHTNGGGYEVVLERTVAGDDLRVVACLKLQQHVFVITAIKC